MKKKKVFNSYTLLCRMLQRKQFLRLFSGLIVLLVVINGITWISWPLRKSTLDKHFRPEENAPEYAGWDGGICNHLLDCYILGTWEFNPGLTKTMIHERREVDKNILENLGFPRELHREDGRCGQINRLFPSGLPSLCDEESERPCCNEATGLCGNSNADCLCPYCKDFSKYFAAELAEWKPSRQECPFELFQSESICALLDEHVSDLVFIGDSFIGHLFLTLTLLITGDPIRGALRSTLSEEEKEQCSGEMQFFPGKHSCHLKLIRDWEELDANQLCNGKPVRFKSHFVEAYNVNQFPSAVKTVKNLLGKRKAIIVLGVGIHIHLNATMVIEKYLVPFLSLIANSDDDRPLLIWANIHQVDNFLTSDSVKNYSPIAKFNKEMSKFCRARNIPVFESSMVTRDIKSNDGQHVGYGGNMAKVQILLNYLKNHFETCQSSEY